MYGKKGALELSINAIVVLILAITILGLGIAFIRGQFGALQEQFTGVSAEVKTELTKKIKESGELVALPQNEIDVTSGTNKRIFFGVQNAKSYEVCIMSTVRCMGAQNPDENSPDDCTVGVPKGAIVGGTGFQSGASKKWVSLPPARGIKAGAVDVLPMDIQVSGAKKDTYFLELIVAEKLASDPTSAEDAKDCSAASTAIDPSTGQFAPEWGEIDTKQFLLNVG
jgi:hypothetical protein